MGDAAMVTQETRDWPRPRVTPRLYSPRDALRMRRDGGRTRFTRMYPRANVAWIERAWRRRNA